MYVPRHYRIDDPEELHELMRAHSFATLISTAGTELTATHLPLLLEAEAGPNGRLLGHMAYANPQWQSFNGTNEALAVFQGPHAYVSPAWYTARDSFVPTWNYVTVHAYGAPRLLEDRADAESVLRATVATYENGMRQPWTLEELDEQLWERLSGAVAAFEMPLTRVEGKAKLGQEKSRADRTGVVAALRKRGGFGSDIAAAMERHAPDSRGQ